MVDTDLEARRQLEIGFAKSIDKVIDQLLSSNFSEYDIDVFTDTVKTFLKFEDLKTYILDALHDKIMEASKIIKPSDQVRFASFRKLVGVVLDINNKDLIDSLETYLSRKQPSDHFFAFIEEKIARGMDVETATNSFMELVKIHYHPREIIDRFLRIIGRDRKYIIEKFLEPNSYSYVQSSLQNYISDIIAYEPYKVSEDVVAPIVEYYNGAIEQYFFLIQEILARTTAHHHILLNNSKLGNIVFQYWAHLLKHSSSYLALIKNFYFYLEGFYLLRADDFESEFLQIAEPNDILTFAKEVPSSKKRKILRRLVEIKSEPHLVAFIKNFPEYTSLLPML